MGPNIGEAVNFATHDWISHGSDSNERYRVSTIVHFDEFAVGALYHWTISDASTYLYNLVLCSPCCLFA
jgi:hypothetical protein